MKKMKTVKRFVESVLTAGKWNLLVIILVYAVWRAFPVFSSYISKYLTDALLARAWIQVVICTGVQIALWIVSAAVSSYDQNVRQMSRTRSENYDALKMREKICRFPMTFFEVPENHDLMNRACGKAGGNISMFMNTSNLIVTILAVVAAIVPLFMIMPAALPVIAVLCAANVIVALKCSDMEYLESVRRLESERRRGYYRSLFYDMNAEKEIKAYNAGEWILSKYEAVSKRIFHEVRKLNIRNGLIAAGMDFISMLVKIALWTYIAFQALEGKITTGNCVLFIGLWDNAVSLAGEIRDNILYVCTSAKNVRGINRLLDFPVETPPRSAPDRVEKIELKDVSFSYPSKQDSPALRNVNVSFVPGKCYLVLGENGAGKSTLIKLLLKQYTPARGTITVNGALDLAEFQDLNAGYMAQDDIHFSLPVLDNIVFGGVYNEEKFRAVTEKAGIAELVQSLPEKEHTLLGKSYGDGRELSGGQWQRISFARLLYKESGVIILDEPTANMDPIAERNLYTEIRNLFRDKIVILISHRLSSVRIADEVVFISNGEALGAGTHDELLAGCPGYSQLVELQNKIITGE